MFKNKEPAHTNSPNRVSIKEANEHLQLVHRKVEQLESIINSQAHKLVLQEKQFKEELERAKSSRSDEISFLKQHIDKLEAQLKIQNTTVSDLRSQLKAKDNQLLAYQELTRLTPQIELLLNSLKIINESNRIQQIHSARNHYHYGDSRSVTFTLNQHESSIDEEVPTSLGISTVGGSIAVVDSNEPYNPMNGKKSKATDSESSSIKSSSSGDSKQPGHSTKFNSTSTVVTIPPNKPAIQTNASNQASLYRISRSFNINSNFSDDEEFRGDGVKAKSDQRRKRD